MLLPSSPTTTSNGACAISSIDPASAENLTTWTQPAAGQCATQIKNGFPVPDPSCTPGAVNPTLTLDVLRDSAFRTGPCVRDKATSAAKKYVTYSWYKTTKPPANTGANQICEEDHLVSLELGGSDTLANIWPQCGPASVALNDRFFKEKDLVENYLAAEVKAGTIDLASAQRGIATDWTQYKPQADAWYQQHGAVRSDGDD